MNMLDLSWTLGAFALALGVLIVVHEFGHYLAARLCGVKVLRFCVGFGRPLILRRLGRDQTEWVLAAFPLGGYVRFLDEREAAVAASDLPRAFNRQSLAKRALIVVAGPLANFVLAVFFYWLLFMQGTVELRPLLAAPPAGSIAAQAGFQEGETVSAVDHEPIATLQELRWALTRLAGLTADPAAQPELDTLDARGLHRTRRLDLSTLPEDALEKDVLAAVGFAPFLPAAAPVIGGVAPDSPAALAGLQAGDEVLGINDRAINSWREMFEVVSRSPERPLRFSLRRGGRVEERIITPRTQARGDQRGETRVGRIGVAAPDLLAAHPELFVTEQHGPAAALVKAGARTWEVSALSLQMVGRMIQGRASLKNISGPVTIADYAGRAAQRGWQAYFSFLALISISLGVLNLLPVPLLDGGHLLYYLAEFFKGGPLSERVMEIGQRAGLTLLILLMLFAFYNDFTRLISG